MKTLFLVCFVACLFLVSVSFGSDRLRQGDLVFASMPCYACDLIEATTGSLYSHVAWVLAPKAGEYQVLMAVPPYAVTVPLSFLQQHARRPLKFMRFKLPAWQQSASQAADAGRVFVGTPYDPDFILGRDRLYCSELIYFSFTLILNGLTGPFPLVRMDFGRYLSRWRTLMGHEPPQGQWGLSPGDIERSPLLRTVVP